MGLMQWDVVGMHTHAAGLNSSKGIIWSDPLLETGVCSPFLLQRLIETDRRIGMGSIRRRRRTVLLLACGHLGYGVIYRLRLLAFVLE
jgi:hypothetical protein